MSQTGPIDRFQQRHPIIGFPLGVLYKFLDDQGAYLAALITYYALLAIFPLLLLMSSWVGWLTRDHPTVRDQILSGAISQIPLLGDEIKAPSALEGGWGAVALGTSIAIYGTLGVAQAIQHSMNSVWGVPRNRRPNPILARVRSAILVFFLAVGLIAAGFLPRVVPGLGGWWGDSIKVVLGSLAFWAMLHLSTAKRARWRELLPGALMMGFWWVFLEATGSELITGVVGRSGPIYGVFSLVFGLILWLYLLALGLVLSAETNVVRAYHLYPRSLLTPMTDNVHLTLADQEAYAQLAQAQRLKQYEKITVVFDRDGDGRPDAPSDLERRMAKEERLRRKKRRILRPPGDARGREEVPPRRLRHTPQGRTTKLTGGLPQGALLRGNTGFRPPTAPIPRRRKNTQPDEAQSQPRGGQRDGQDRTAPDNNEPRRDNEPRHNDEPRRDEPGQSGPVTPGSTRPLPQGSRRDRD